MPICVRPSFHDRSGCAQSIAAREKDARLAREFPALGDADVKH